MVLARPRPEPVIEPELEAETDPFRRAVLTHADLEAEIKDAKASLRHEPPATVSSCSPTLGRPEGVYGSPKAGSRL